MAPRASDSAAHASALVRYDARPSERRPPAAGGAIPSRPAVAGPSPPARPMTLSPSTRRALALGRAALAVAAAALLVPREGALGFSKIGGSLNVDTQRDFRVFNDFEDNVANDNQTENPSFPGWYGADRALWKAAVEWGSRPHADDSGDPTQAVLGDGGANFDFFFAGEATSAGGSNRNIVSTVQSCSGGTLAYVLSPIANGWTMRFCENRRWSDGPGGPSGNQFDLQGVGCHEFGHALGLGHSNVNGATMVGSTINGFPQRSIAVDDIAGLHCIYGPLDPTKPEITATSFDPFGGTVTIEGRGFGDGDNDVWFTRALATPPGQAGPQVVVSGVQSTNGGTRIVVVAPPEAGSGDVAVRVTSVAGGRGLSNTWPLDLLRGGGAFPLALTAVVPGEVEALTPGSEQQTTLTGRGFEPETLVTLNGVLLPSTAFTIVDDGTITVDLPRVSTLGTQTIGVVRGVDAAETTLEVVEPAQPTLEAATGDPLAPVQGGVDLAVGGPVGETEIVLYSFSSVPSTSPLVSLALGNGFLDLFLVDLYTVPAAGWTQETFPLQPTTIDLWLQALTLERGFPLVVGNLQSISILP